MQALKTNKTKKKSTAFTCGLYGDERNPAILQMAQDVHAFAVPVRPFRAGTGETLLNGAWRLRTDNPAWKHCLADLADFLERMQGSPRQGGAPKNTFILTHKPDSSKTDAVITVEPGTVTVTAGDIRAAWQAIAWLEHEMAWRHAPVLPLGRHGLRPRFGGRITTSLFAPGLDKPDDPHAFTTPYLRSMAHYGYSGFFIYINIWDFVQSHILPELNAARAQANLAALRDLNARAEACGLDVYMLLAAPGFPTDHKVFKSHPELRGGTSSSRRLHSLCTSKVLTRKFFAEQMTRLCKVRPAPGGVIFVIGGEGFRHCYTTPNPRTENVTNCARCARARPAQVMAPLMNAMTTAIRQAAPDARSIFWPYSSIVWQKKPFGQYKWEEDLDLINRLDRRSTWILEMEKDAEINIPEVGVTRVYDYSIQYIGPSPKFKLEAGAAKRRGLEMAVKTETTQTIELFSLPYIPVMQRWAARQSAIRASTANFAIDTWRLNGFWQAPSVELAYWLTMDKPLTDNEALHRVACRLYGSRAADKVIQAWQSFSKAWETSYARYGTYWDGPLFLGPAHPFDIGTAFLARSVYSRSFYHVSPGMREHGDDEVVLEIMRDPQRFRPKFHLMPCRWAKARRRDYTRAAGHWRRGMACLRQALRDTPKALAARAGEDADMAEMVGLFLEADTAFNTFACLRDTLNHTHIARPTYRKLLCEIDQVLADDLIRSQRGLEITRRNPFIGWGYTFGTRFTAEMIEEKIGHTRALQQKARACIKSGEALVV